MIHYKKIINGGDKTRTKLKKYEGQKIRVVGELSEKKDMQLKRKIKLVYIITNIKTIEGEYLTDHAVIEPCKKMRRLKLKNGSAVEFDAVVKKYTKLCELSKKRKIPVFFNTFDYGFFEISNPIKVV